MQIIGVLGTYHFTKSLKQKILNFLKTNLNTKKLCITNAFKPKPVYFLSINVSRLTKVKSEIKNCKNKKGHAKKKINRFGIVTIIGESRGGAGKIF